MARLNRLILENHTHHLIQVGNNKAPIFFTTEDYQKMLNLLGDYAGSYQVDIHGFVLMPANFQLLATPRVDTGLSKMMQALGRGYVRYFNDKYKRTGTLWEGRYRSTVLDEKTHLLNHMVYIELQPVIHGLVDGCKDYEWSSYMHNAGVRKIHFVKNHKLYWELGNTPFAREASYVALIAKGISSQQQRSFDQAVLNGWPIGSPDFLSNIQGKTDRRVFKSKAGRPKGGSI